MIMNLYTIYDEVADEHGPVFEAKNDAVALRNFNGLIAEQSKKSDYQLFRIGQFDRDTGYISNVMNRVNVSFTEE